MTDWKARALSAEKALGEIDVKLEAAKSLMISAGWWANRAGYTTDAALWIEQAQRLALASLLPAPEGEGQ